MTRRMPRFTPALAIAGAGLLVAAGALAAVHAVNEHPTSATPSAATPNSSTTPTGNVFTVTVWTSGGQDEIDACKGAVDVTKIYGVHTIAEHDHCGGDAFPKTEGALVRLTGKDAGTYRVDGIIAHLNGKKDTSADIPRGHDLVFQTCNDGYTDMTFTGLTKVA